MSPQCGRIVDVERWVDLVVGSQACGSSAKPGSKTFQERLGVQKRR